MGDEVTIRDSTDADLSRITAIYARSVETDVASFELTPPDVAEMARRREERLAQNMPYIVAELDGEVVGYAYAGRFHARPAYAATVENSVYVDPKAHRRGIGRKLLEKVIGECTQRGFRQMIAVISGTEDSPSIFLHRALGFEQTGRNRSVGYKHGKWIDTWYLQLSLGEGDTTPPTNVPESRPS